MGEGTDRAMIAIPPGAIVETSVEYPPEVEKLRADLLATIGDRFARIRVGTMTRPEDVREAVELAHDDTAALMAQLMELEVFGRPTMIVRRPDADAE